MNISVDESMYDPRYAYQYKEISQFDKDGNDNHSENPDPFLLAGSKIMNGAGKAIVCSVGNNTRFYRTIEKEDLRIRTEETFLEKRLSQTATQISKYVLTMIVMICIL